MDIVLANHSTYPGGTSDVLSRDRELSRVIDEQIAAGLDLITDGCLGWHDPVTPLLAALEGVRLGRAKPVAGLAAEIPVPIVEAKLRRRRPLVLDAYRRAAALSSQPVKTVLTGPYTLARIATIATTAYAGMDALADELAVFLAHEIAALAAIGAPAVQIDEPLILAHPADVRRLRELLEPLYDAAGGSTEVIATTYGDDASAIYAQLNSLPADLIGVDCTYPGVCDAIEATGSGKPLALGVVDGRSADVDDPAAIAEVVERLLHRYVHPNVLLQPSRGLGALPTDIARAKVGVLSPLRALLQPRQI